jgi:hypothetical protein
MALGYFLSQLHKKEKKKLKKSLKKSKREKEVLTTLEHVPSPVA